MHVQNIEFFFKKRIHGKKSHAQVVVLFSHVLKKFFSQKTISLFPLMPNGLCLTPP